MFFIRCKILKLNTTLLLGLKNLRNPCICGIVDTNWHPDEVDYVIPANDDAIRAVKLIVAAMADAICEAKSEPLTVAYVKR